jgi:glyoxylase-like metal-dependent hydrolase (beta-lactamase superfamily II)
LQSEQELASSSGAGAAPAKLDFMPAHDGDEIHLGSVTLRFLETPGHTPESISIVIFDNPKAEGTPYGVLTGDILFIGDVGRPDLLGSRMSANELAGMLYDSLHQQAAETSR